MTWNTEPRQEQGTGPGVKSANTKESHSDEKRLPLYVLLEDHLSDLTEYSEYWSTATPSTGTQCFMGTKYSVLRLLLYLLVYETLRSSS